MNHKWHKDLEKILGYHMKNGALLETALTHSSYANVHKQPSYERLEYLGDSVLSLIARDFLFHKYSNLPEGHLTKIQSAVLSERSLFEIAEELHLSKFIRFVPEYDGQTPKRSIVADIVEAIIAAIYLDSGLKNAKKFVLKLFEDKFEQAREGHFLRDYITEINEIVQKHKWTVEYKVLKSNYDAHSSYFKMALVINGKQITTGEGENKKDAMRQAAERAFEQGLLS